MNKNPTYYWPTHQPWPYDVGEESNLYMGTAQSDFQANPWSVYGKTGSDWELVFRQSKDHDQAPNFHKYMDTYFDRSLALGENMYRISFDVARLYPSIGELNEDMMKLYVKMLIKLRVRGLEPMVTLYHWPLPLTLCGVKKNAFTSGGWEHGDVVRYFIYYADIVQKVLRDKEYLRRRMEELDLGSDQQAQILDTQLVKYFITINEPSTLWLNSYMAGVFPPYKKFRLLSFNTLLDKMATVHEHMSECFLRYGKVGVAHNWTYFDGWMGNYLQKHLNEAITAKFEQRVQHSDFVALQYYCRTSVPSLATRPLPPSWQIRPMGRDYGDHPDFGDIFPQGIYYHLKRMHQLYPSKPLWVTEFGFPDNDDLRRPHWLAETVRWMLQAKHEGIPLKGILHWSLVQNYEWEQGMKVSFGLFEEKELNEPLLPDDTPCYGKTRVRSWEMWKAILAFNYCPGQDYYENLKKLRYEAYIQYESRKKRQK